MFPLKQDQNGVGVFQTERGKGHLTCGHVLLGPIMLGKEREDAGEEKTVLMGFGDV